MKLKLILTAVFIITYGLFFFMTRESVNERIDIALKEQIITKDDLIIDVTYPIPSVLLIDALVLLHLFPVSVEQKVSLNTLFF